jgi:hypothetical protein
MRQLLAKGQVLCRLQSWGVRRSDELTFEVGQEEFQKLFGAFLFNKLLGGGDPLLFRDERRVFLAEDGVDTREAVERVPVGQRYTRSR